MNSRRLTKSLGLLYLPTLMAACSEGDLSVIDAPGEPRAGAEQTDHHDAVDPRQHVSARLEVDGQDLLLSVRNRTGVRGALRAHSLVENEEAVFFTDDVGRTDFGPYEEVVLRLSPATVQGLDLSRHEWTDARVSFAYTLEDGREGGDYAFVLAREGQVVSALDLPSSGVAHGVPEPEVEEDAQDALIEKQAGSFSVCFDHIISFASADNNPIDHFRAAGTHRFHAYGLHIGAERPQGDVLTVYLDLQGCANLPRTAGTWKFNVFLQSVWWPIEPMLITALKSNGSIPMKQLGPVSVTAQTTTLGTLDFSMASGEDSDLQTALVIAQHTIKRGMSLGTVVNPEQPNLILKLLPSGSQLSSGYVHATRTIELQRFDAVARGTTAHEVGHWIHRSWNTPRSNKTYCTPGTTPACTSPPADGCTRSPLGDGLVHIEWSSHAHIEGFAEFFKYLAFNNASSGSDCWVPSAVPNAPDQIRNCESLGLTMKTGNAVGGSCFEWRDSTLQSKVGTSLDWAKMYWDLFADETGLGNTRLRNYLLLENGITGWSDTNHLDKLLEVTQGTPMNLAIQRSATGNIRDGIAH